MRLSVRFSPRFAWVTRIRPFDDANVTVAKDDAEAIEQGNVIGGRTRGAKPSGGYKEPGDEEGLPGAEDGTSSTR